MKKSIIIVALCFFGLSNMNAQVTFKPGLRGGLNFSHLTQTDNPNEKFSAKTDFYVGFYGALNLTKIYTLQPELNYSRQGSKYEYIDNSDIHHKGEIDLSYLSIGLANKFNFEKFNIHVGPTIDIRVNDNKKDLGDSSDVYYDNFNDIDLAFFFGAGYKFNDNFGIEARIKKGIIPVNGDWEYTNVVFQTGINYTF